MGLRGEGEDREGGGDVRKAVRFCIGIESMW